MHQPIRARESLVLVVCMPLLLGLTPGGVRAPRDSRIAVHGHVESTLVDERAGPPAPSVRFLPGRLAPTRGTAAGPGPLAGVTPSSPPCQLAERGGGDEHWMTTP